MKTAAVIVATTILLVPAVIAGTLAAIVGAITSGENCFRGGGLK